jgi:hypothetical protein
MMIPPVCLICLHYSTFLSVVKTFLFGYSEIAPFYYFLCRRASPGPAHFGTSPAPGLAGDVGDVGE